MNSRCSRRWFAQAVWLAGVLCALAVVGGVRSQSPKAATLPPAATAKVDFQRDIQPFLASRCIRCHGPKKVEGGLRLDRKSEAFAGGNRGPALEVGKSASSRLIHYVAGLDQDIVMPPSGKRLSAEEIGLLRAWIDQGAAWPQEKTSPAEDRSDHWAFQPIRRPPAPQIQNAEWVRTPIDRFILVSLEKENLRPSPEADRVTLIRRLSLDLLGLPPSPAEVDAVLRDKSRNWYERLVDRLLASPHYGERWGRHWLDVARYADSDGYNADAARPIWKYRDWVINALNKDMPFDQFVIEQLAGDLLPNPTLEQRTATGFHRNTLFNAEGGNDPEEFRVERVVDRVSTTGVAFLGLTVGCAECHAHKYDPISQREFYELYAFFNNAEEVKLETPTPEQEAARTKHREKMKALQARLQNHDQVEASKSRVQRAGSALLSLASPPWFPAGHASLIANAYSSMDPVRQRLATDLAVLQKREPGVAATLALEEKPQNRRPTRIHVRGDFRRPGATVTPNVPRVLPLLTVPVSQPPKTPSRRDLARWLVSPENPLTARVTVNRLWQRYFGVGLVETENDFGAQGKAPSHPELLDWLAAEFMHGWGLKAMHRLIVTSATYRQASNYRKDLAAVDPNNRLLGRQVRLRLEAEIVRDVMLSASGLLSPKIGGPSVFPYQPPGVTETRRSPFAWMVSSGPDRYRRGMYTHFWRTSPHPFLMAFDAPKSDTACTRRHRSNTPLQALMLLNDPMFMDCARGLAGRILKEGPASQGDRIRYAVRLCMGRTPDSAEQKVIDDLLREQLQAFKANVGAARRLAGPDVSAANVAERAAWTAVARVLLNLDECITRE